MSELVREKESRDKLGIGGVRDAIADRVVPGTSPIKTRIRYMLLIPRILPDLEERRESESTFGARA